MLIKLDMKSSVPIYVQLRNQIVLGIGRGDIGIGEKLPTVRQLAEDIGVNNMTVNKAYTILKNEGYIEIDRRQGAKISETVLKQEEFSEKMEGELELLIVEARLNGYDEKEILNMCKGIISDLKIKYVESPILE